MSSTFGPSVRVTERENKSERCRFGRRSRQRGFISVLVSGEVRGKRSGPDDGVEGRLVRG